MLYIITRVLNLFYFIIVNFLKGTFSADDWNCINFYILTKQFRQLALAYT